MIEIGFNPSVTGSLMAARAYSGLFKDTEYTEIVQMNFMLDITNCNQSCLWDLFRPSKFFLEILKKVIDK